MRRDTALAALRTGERWDVAIVGGGATGLACALDAASRGYRTVLLERDDFAQGTSSRSTKLIHGGVRYLRQGHIGLVQSALRERTRLLENAPEFVRPIRFVIPAYSQAERLYYGAGLKLYDLLARGRQPESSRILSRAETLAALPTLRDARLRGGVSYSDCQFDDAALALALARTAWREGAILVNHAPVAALRRRDGRLHGLAVRDAESGAECEIEARVVVNAGGVFSDAVRQLDEPAALPRLAPSQGAHLVLPRKFLPGDAALLVPKTTDGRVLFAVPWHERVLLGTTDTPVTAVTREPVPLAEEVEFLLAHAAEFLASAPRRADVLAAFAGLRPLVRAGQEEKSAALARDHLVSVSPSGLVTITGGKWTTCRRMAEDAVDRAAQEGQLPRRPCRTAALRLAGPLTETTAAEPPLHPALPIRRSDVVMAANETMARTLEDVLARRTRCLYLDARAAAEIAPQVADLLAATLGHGTDWQAAEVGRFRALAERHRYA